VCSPEAFCECASEVARERPCLKEAA
jgi:hypothetical protein